MRKFAYYMYLTCKVVCTVGLQLGKRKTEEETQKKRIQTVAVFTE